MRSLLLLLIVAGCSAPQRDYHGEFVPVVSIACGVSEGGGVATPDDTTTCQTCDGKGRLPIRDTGRFEDCPDCDLDPPLTPLSASSPAAPTVKQSLQVAPALKKEAEDFKADIVPAEPTPELAEPPAPKAVEWLTWPEAAALSKATGRPVLVLQRFRDPAQDAACLPCQRLKKTLDSPEALEAFAELGIPCLGYADDWQKQNVTAPTLALVRPDDAPNDKVQSLSGFRVAPLGDFLADVRTWLDGLDQ